MRLTRWKLIDASLTEASLLKIERMMRVSGEERVAYLPTFSGVITVSVSVCGSPDSQLRVSDGFWKVFVCCQGLSRLAGARNQYHLSWPTKTG